MWAARQREAVSVTPEAHQRGIEEAVNETIALHLSEVATMQGRMREVMALVGEYKEQKETMAAEAGRLTGDNRVMAGNLANAEAKFADMQAQRDMLTISQEKAIEARHAAEAKIEQLQDSVATFTAARAAASKSREQHARELVQQVECDRRRQLVRSVLVRLRATPWP